jgi:hypothetical protein
MQNIVKERMFGNFMNEDTKVSEENYYNIDLINRRFHWKSKNKDTLDYSIARKCYSIELTNPRLTSCLKNHHRTIDASRNDADYILKLKTEATKKRSFTRKLPSIVDKMVENANPLTARIEHSHQKKLDINEKILG